MLTKTNFVITLFLFSICLLFAACQKEEIIDTPPAVIISPPPPPSIYAHLEGDFYTQRIGKSSYSSSGTYFFYQDTADMQIQVSTENDTLRVLGYTFPIDSLSQTSFYQMSSNSMTNPRGEWKLDYYNNYDSIVLSHDDLCGGGYNPCNKVVYSGAKTSKRKPMLGAVTYTLAVIHKEFRAQIDTQYTADLMVSTNLLSSINYPHSYENRKEFMIGNNTLQFNIFQTYSQEHKSGNAGSSKKIAYFKNDSLYIDYQVVESGVYAPVVPLDTVYYSFRGVKK